MNTAIGESLPKIKLPQINPEQTCREIGEFVIDIIRRAKSTGFVIGLSGGVDSSTTAGIIKRTFDEYNSIHQDKLEIVGYILPSKINTATDQDYGVMVAKQLHMRYEIQDISQIVEAYRTTNPEAFLNNVDKGNMISRIRSNVLSTKAATEKKSIAGTGNKDEDFGLGYYTLFGDGAVHCSPIGGLSKRLVRQMATYLGIDNDITHREPTAALEPGQTDFTDLGYKYDIVELVIEGIQQGFTQKQLARHYQIVPLIEEQIAMQKNPKYHTADEIIDDILYRNKIAQLKTEIVHPPVASITLRYE